MAFNTRRSHSCTLLPVAAQLSRGLLREILEIIDAVPPIGELFGRERLGVRLAILAGKE